MRFKSIDHCDTILYNFTPDKKNCQSKMNKKSKKILSGEIMEAQKYVFTVDQVAEILQISRPQAYLGVSTGQIPSIRVGRRILVPRAALEKLLATAGSQA